MGAVMTNRAYSLIEKAAVDDGRRVFSGMATTPEPDRMQDTINPLGAVFKNPIALLHQHRHDAPIGTVTFGKPTEKGIPFTAEIPVIEEAGTLKDRVDTAWGEIKSGLVRAVSIGFRPIKHAYLESGGIDFQEVEIYELSTVSIPANPGAVITQVKSIDRGLRQSLGLVDDPVQQPQKRAMSGKTHPVVKLAGPAHVRAKPFVVRKIHT